MTLALALAVAPIAPNWPELQRAALAAVIADYDDGSFARDRSAPELNAGVRLLYPASRRTCRECDAQFESSAVTSTLFCEMCIAGSDQPKEMMR